MVCPECGAENAENSKFCQKCGASLVPLETGTATTSIGLDQNIAALLSYLLGWPTGILFYALEKQNDFVRFHAMQSIVTFGGLTWAAVVSFGVSVLLVEVPYIGVIVWLFWVLGWLWVFLVAILWVVLMVKACQGKRYKLPWAGDFAEKYK